MVTASQIKKEIYTLIRKGPYEPALNDIVNEAALKSLLFSRYAYDLTDDEFNLIGDELADSGDFYWNNDGKLALNTGGIAYLNRNK